MAPIRVVNLSAAIEFGRTLRNAFAFLIAPLATQRGGRRSWHAIKGDSWQSVNVGPNESEPIPPLLDDGAEDLPTLPASPLRLWEVVFLDRKAEELAERCLIDPSIGDVIDVDATEPTERTTRGQPNGPSPSNASEAIQAYQLASQILKQHLNSMASLTEATHKIIDTQRRDNDALRERQAKIDLQHQEAVAANMDLAAQLAEAKAGDQFMATVQVLFKDKPELLLGAVKDLLSGLAEKIKIG